MSQVLDNSKMFAKKVFFANKSIKYVNLTSAIQYTAAAILQHAKTDTHLGHRAMLQALVGNQTALARAATGTAFHSGHLDSGS